MVVWCGFFDKSGRLGLHELLRLLGSLFSALYYQQKVWYFMEMDVGRKRNGMRILLVTSRNYGGWLKVQR
jgi:hypothetical protein